MDLKTLPSLDFGGFMELNVPLPVPVPLPEGAAPDGWPSDGS